MSENVTLKGMQDEIVDAVYPTVSQVFERFRSAAPVGVAFYSGIYNVFRLIEETGVQIYNEVVEMAPYVIDAMKTSWRNSGHFLSGSVVTYLQESSVVIFDAANRLLSNESMSIEILTILQCCAVYLGLTTLDTLIDVIITVFGVATGKIVALFSKNARMAKAKERTKGYEARLFADEIYQSFFFRLYKTIVWFLQQSALVTGLASLVIAFFKMMSDRPMIINPYTLILYSMVDFIRLSLVSIVRLRPIRMAIDYPDVVFFVIPVCLAMWRLYGLSVKASAKATVVINQTINIGDGTKLERKSIIDISEKMTYFGEIIGYADTLKALTKELEEVRTVGLPVVSIRLLKRASRMSLDLEFNKSWFIMLPFSVPITVLTKTFSLGIWFFLMTLRIPYLKKRGELAPGMMKFEPSRVYIFREVEFFQDHSQFYNDLKFLVVLFGGKKQITGSSHSVPPPAEIEERREGLGSLMDPEVMKEENVPKAQDSAVEPIPVDPVGKKIFLKMQNRDVLKLGGDEGSILTHKMPPPSLLTMKQDKVLGRLVELPPRIVDLMITGTLPTMLGEKGGVKQIGHYRKPHRVPFKPIYNNHKFIDDIAIAAPAVAKDLSELCRIPPNAERELVENMKWSSVDMPDDLDDYKEYLGGSIKNFCFAFVKRIFFGERKFKPMLPKELMKEMFPTQLLKKFPGLVTKQEMGFSNKGEAFDWSKKYAEQIFPEFVAQGKLPDHLWASIPVIKTKGTRKPNPRDYRCRAAVCPEWWFQLLFYCLMKPLSDHIEKDKHGPSQKFLFFGNCYTEVIKRLKKYHPEIWETMDVKDHGASAAKFHFDVMSDVLKSVMLSRDREGLIIENIEHWINSMMEEIRTATIVLTDANAGMMLKTEAGIKDGILWTNHLGSFCTAINLAYCFARKYLEPMFPRATLLQECRTSNVLEILVTFLGMEIHSDNCVIAIPRELKAFFDFEDMKRYLGPINMVLKKEECERVESQTPEGIEMMGFRVSRLENEGGKYFPIRSTAYGIKSLAYLDREPVEPYSESFKEYLRGIMMSAACTEYWNEQVRAILDRWWHIIGPGPFQPKAMEKLLTIYELDYIPHKCFGSDIDWGRLGNDLWFNNDLFLPFDKIRAIYSPGRSTIAAMTIAWNKEPESRSLTATLSVYNGYFTPYLPTVENWNKIAGVYNLLQVGFAIQGKYEFLHWFGIMFVKAPMAIVLGIAPETMELYAGSIFTPYCEELQKETHGVKMLLAQEFAWKTVQHIQMLYTANTLEESIWIGAHYLFSCTLSLVVHSALSLIPSVPLRMVLHGTWNFAASWQWYVPVFVTPLARAMTEIFRRSN